ncbi:MAG: SUMF1/EgtB/PvdO family nonheme iron enzyme [Gammaproteobacteria bacterium]|nr:SUMF1/EgtB/PvdO family nonheme iron enzyme [Gammaproteobacteria bacterium]
MNTLEQKLEAAGKRFRARLGVAVLAGVLLLVVALPLVYFVQVVSFRISPQMAADTASVSLSGGVGWVLSNRAYLFGGPAALRFEAPGFISREVALGPATGAGPVAVIMREAPVNVVITTEPALAQTRWRVDGVYAATAERFVQRLPPGTVRIEVDHEFYRVETLPVEVKTGQDVARHLNLRPVAGTLDIRSEPGGARVVLDGLVKGVTPVEVAAVPGGVHRLQVLLDGYQMVEEEIPVTNRSTDIKRDYRLKPQQTDVRISASPPGGVLRVNGVAAEAARVRSLEAGRKHVLGYEKPGYVAQSREVTLRPDERAEISFQLQPEWGEVVVRSAPPADIMVDGKAAGTTPQTLRLQALPHRIILTRPGYRAVELPVMPTASAPLLIDRQLQTERAARLAQAAPFLSAAAGVRMKYFDPRAQSGGRFTMGSPVGEKFRRANEFQRRVDLTKAFYVSVTEITEEQFAHYKPAQTAGRNLPVRDVSWLDAAGFCNWMSAQDGLQPAYRFGGGQLQSFDPTADGYRLLSEAEWEWLARVAGRREAARFVWGNDTTIPAGSGNLADESAKGSVPQYIARYRDGFAGVAPVASFAADAAGLYDMAGNLSEWMHDRYSLQPPGPGQVERNPFGGRYGDSRVIKGANFRSASVTGLRSSFRDGLLNGRDDVGFRVARYLYGKE